MPDVVTPARLRWTGAALIDEPAFEFLTPARLRWTGALVSDGPTSNLSDSPNIPKLDTQKRQIPIGEVRDGKVYVTAQEQNRQQNYRDAIQDAFRGQQGQITDLATIVARLEAAEAQAAAATAQAAETAAADALARSYIEPSDVLAASSAGEITITAHTRVYGNGASVSVNGGSLSGWAPGQFVQVYYDDAGRTGGAVSYQGTTDVIAQQGARHIVGGVAIPQPGQPASSGGTAPPPGYVRPFETDQTEQAP